MPINPLTKKEVELPVWMKPPSSLVPPKAETSAIIEPTKNPDIIQPPNPQVQLAGLMANKPLTFYDPKGQPFQFQGTPEQFTDWNKWGYTLEPPKTPPAEIPPTPPAETPVETTEPTIWEKLLGRQEKLETKIAEQPTAETLVTEQLGKWGITPESLQGMNTISAQIGEVNKQIATLDTQEAESLNRVELTPGQSLEFMSGEQRRISREYSIKRAGLAGQASALGTQLAALQGNFNLAKSMASMTIDAVLTDRKQTINDLKWADTFYADIIIAMDKSDQIAWETQLKYQDKLYQDQKSDLEAIGKMVSNPLTSGAFTGTDWSKLSLAEAQDLVGRYTQTPAYLQRVAQIEAAERKPEISDVLTTIGGETLYDESLLNYLTAGNSARQAVMSVIAETGESFTEKEKTAMFNRAKEIETAYKEELAKQPKVEPIVKPKPTGGLIQKAGQAALKAAGGEQIGKGGLIGKVSDFFVNLFGG